MVDIVLATYNGAEHLAEFIESLRRQTYAEWRLLIRDDGSCDGTPRLLDRLARDDQRVVILPHDGQRYGPVQNFAHLMRASLAGSADQVFFADQDDVWLPGKIERQLDRLRRAEFVCATSTPVLVHSDLTVVDEKLRVIHRSRRRHGRFRYDRRNLLKSLLLHNSVTGCATVVNRALLRLASPIPEQAVMHDWWLALCAAAAGRIEFLQEPTALYRQHGKNLIGATSFWSKPVALLSSRARWNAGMDVLRRSVAQAEMLQKRLSERNISCESEAIQLLDEFCRIFRRPLSGMQRIRELRRMKLPDVHPLRQVLSYWQVLTLDGCVSTPA